MPIDPLLILIPSFVIGFAIIIVGIYYINRKYPEKKYKTDPILKACAIVGLFLVIFVVAVGVGVIDKEWFQKNLKWFAIALILLIAFYTYIAYRLRKAIPFHKLHKMALNDAWECYQAKPCVGLAHFPTPLYHNVFEGGVPREKTEKLGIQPITGTVDAFLLSLKSSVIFTLLIVLNVFTGQNVKMVYNPSYSLIDELLGKEAVSIYKEFKEEFEEKEVEEEKKKEE